MSVVYWSGFAIFYLLWLTWQDVTQKCYVDDRKNYFMMGLTISLYSHFPHPFVHIVLILAVVLGFYWAASNYKIVGEADIKTLGWILLGLAIVGFSSLIFFGVVFAVLTCFYVVLARLYRARRVPFYPVITAAFLVVVILTKLY